MYFLWSNSYTIIRGTSLFPVKYFVRYYKRYRCNKSTEKIHTEDCKGKGVWGGGYNCTPNTLANRTTNRYGAGS